MELKVLKPSLASYVIRSAKRHKITENNLILLKMIIKLIIVEVILVKEMTLC